MTRLIIDQTVPLKDYTAENWEEILEHGSFRGYNIQRFMRKLEKDPDSIGFNKETSTLTYSKNGEVKFEIPLYKIRKCKSRWSASRFIYWIKTELFCVEKTDTRKLAEYIHEKIPVGGRDKSEEKTKWREHKAAMSFSTMDEMKEVISPETYDLIDRTSFTEEHKVLIGKVHQAKEFYKKDYYTFIHGQVHSYFVINQLIKALEKLKDPDQDVTLYHFLRLPHQELKTTREEHIKRSRFCKRLGMGYDCLLGDELLSVDGEFFHFYGCGESANDYIQTNESSHMTNQRPIIEKILNEYAINNEGLIDEIRSLCNEFNTLATIGQIYAIHIPKEKFKDYVYASQAYGFACDDVDDNSQLKRINKLQKHRALSWIESITIPQYRILTHFLNPEETPITFHTPISKANKDDFKEKIRALAKTAYDNRVVA